MLYNLFASPRYEKDVAIAKKRGMNIEDLIAVVEKLQKGEKLEWKHKDHPLHGNFEETRECHIKPDWLSVYSKDDEIRLLSLVRTGTHSDLFK